MDLIAKLQSGIDSLARIGFFRDRAMAQSKRDFIANREQNLFFGVFDTWEEAEAEVRSLGVAGYANEASAVLYDHRTRIDSHDYPALCWLMRSMHEGMRGIGDLGGSIGIKYIAFRDPLAAWPDLSWTVHDVPEAVAHGRKLSAARGDGSQLSFADRMEDLQSCDVLLASGVLQYLPQTLGEAMSGWQRLPKRIIINTAPIHPVNSFFTVNSLGTGFCPYRVQTQADLVRALSGLGYKVRESWINSGKLMTIPLHPEHSLGHYTGLCLDRRDARR